MQEEVPTEHKEPEHKEEHKEQPKKERKPLFSFLKKNDGIEHTDWVFGVYMLGIIILLFFQANFLPLAVWSIVWALFLMYFNKL